MLIYIKQNYYYFDAGFCDCNFLYLHCHLIYNDHLQFIIFFQFIIYFHFYFRLCFCITLPIIYCYFFIIIFPYYNDQVQIILIIFIHFLNILFLYYLYYIHPVICHKMFILFLSYSSIFLTYYSSFTYYIQRYYYHNIFILSCLY